MNMTTLHSHYVLEERRSGNTQIWRGSHISIYCLTAIFGALSTLWFYKLLLVFGGNCVLHPYSINFVSFTDNSTNTTSYDISALDGPGVEHWTSSPFVKDPRISTVDPNQSESIEMVTIVQTNPTTSQTNDNISSKSDDGVILNTKPLENGTREMIKGPGAERGRRVTIVDVLHTSWASDETCELTLYAPVLSVIFGVIWLVFFVMCPASGERSITGIDQPWRILVPAGVFSLVMVGVSLHTAWTMQNGLTILCRHFHIVTGSTQCTSAVDVLAPSPESSALGASTLVTLSVCSVWSCALCWVTCLLLVVARLVLAPDFTVKKITVRLMEQGESTARRLYLSDTDAETIFTSLPNLVKTDTDYTTRYN